MATKIQQTAAQKWEAALTRAIEERISLRFDREPGALASSGTAQGIEYRVTFEACTCKAGEKGLICKHRAALLFASGKFDSIQEPETNESLIVSQTCPSCDGEGFSRMYTGGRLSDWWAIQCRVCEGGGQVPSPVAAVETEFAAKIAA